ncbi:MAG TPA: HNH endonuclease [Caulobacteraceae bacterium]|jgi:hypothetical protein|nr:HNH endonuclease [Caulobacteraceae bacterium]
MAHVIAKAEGGPRGVTGGGSDSYDNLILLCPTCHRDVDKAPAGTFPAEELRHWKLLHEDRTRNLGSEELFSSNEELAGRVRFLLTENRSIWANYGPKSEAAMSDPGSNLHGLWELRRADRIVPNNRRIMNIVQANQRLLTAEQVEAYGKFVAHADAYERHVHSRLDRYPLFPAEFEKAFQ